MLFQIKHISKNIYGSRSKADFEKKLIKYLAFTNYLSQRKNRTTCDLHNTLRRSKGQKVYSVSLYGKDQRYYHLLECKKPFSFNRNRFQENMHILILFFHHFFILLNWCKFLDHLDVPIKF